MISVKKLSADTVGADLAQTIGRHSLLASTSFNSVWAALSGKLVFWVAEEGGCVLAVLAGVEFGRGPLARFQSMPDGLSSTLCFMSDKSDKVHLSSQILDGISRFGYVKAHVTDFDNSLPPHSTFQRRQMSTHVVDIADPGYEPTDKTLISEIRKAERDKTTVDRFDWSQHGSRFIDLVTLSETRHGRLPKYSARFFEQLALVAKHDNRILWTWCEHDRKPVASHIYFVHGTNAINWQIYYDKKFSSLKANQLATWKAIAELRTRGVTQLNLGASPDGAEGLVAYKIKWNATAYSYSIMEKKTWLGKLL